MSMEMNGFSKMSKDDIRILKTVRNKKSGMRDE
jgi:hypothetical protein